ncbi:MAG TPA: hypothetical protein VF460_08455 [Burkholderiales bacterium]
MRLSWLPAILSLAAAGMPAAHAEPLHRYQVEVSDSLDRMRVRACFEGAAPSALQAETSGARAFLKQVELPGGAPARLPDGERIPLEGVADDSCIEYRVQLDPVRGGAQSGGPESRWVGRDLLTSIGDWLWRPPADAGELELSFKLPEGVNVSTPWRPVPGAGGTRAYRLGPTPNWAGIVAFGRFTERHITVGNANLHVAMLDGPPPQQQASIERWIAEAARNVATLRGRFPVDSVQVIVAPTPRGTGPVPWAYVSRGGGPAVHFFINPTHPPKAFERDWSATHEMSHLFLPYVVARDVWLTEGLPTYLQNTLMARGGAIDEREAWKRMIVGFQRAAKVGTGMSLARASERVGVGGLYQRVYWAGAALMLEADLRLREQSGGSQSLDTALDAITQCCLGQDRRWSAAELTEQLDRATGSTVFSDIVRDRLDDGEFPDFQAVLVRAGVTVVNGEVVLDPAAPWAAQRESLMRRSED